MEMNRENLSAVSDLPVASVEEDFLSNNKYASGLCEFIRQAGTPLTIGIQGGWGSGKTSLMKLLEMGLLKSDNVDGGTLCVKINAWQHSLFQANNQVAVALSLLTGMVRGIEDVIEESKCVEKSGLDKFKASIRPGLVTLGKFAGGVAAVGVNMFSVHGMIGHASEALEGGDESGRGWWRRITS